MRLGPAALALCAACAGERLTAQEPARATLRGTVVAAESGERVAFAVVRLDPGFAQRFADDAGGFAITGVAPGSYRLVVRQVGYVPYDSAVTVGPGTPALRIELRRIAVELAELRIAASSECTAPGMPDSAADPALAVIFDQLRQNAAQYELLAVQYPHEYRLARRFTEYERGGDEHAMNSLLQRRSADRTPYVPGKVITPVRGMRDTWEVHLPTLPDFAAPAFHANHCFRLAGTDSVEGRAFIRIDFDAATALRWSDVSGSAWLDPVTYQVRHTTVRLTRLERGITEWTANSAFKELAPNVIVLERISAITQLDPGPGDHAITARTEEQQLVGVTFERPLPSSRDSTRTPHDR